MRPRETVHWENRMQIRGEGPMSSCEMLTTHRVIQEKVRRRSWTLDSSNSAKPAALMRGEYRVKEKRVDVNRCQNVKKR